MSQIGLEETKPHRADIFVASFGVVSPLFFGRHFFGTGPGRKSSGCYRSGANRVSAWICGSGGRCDTPGNAVSAGALLPLSAFCGSSWVCIHWGGAAAVLNGSIWFFVIVFCLLFYCFVWWKWCFACTGGFWSAVCGDIAGIFSSGRSCVGKFRGTGVSVPWEGTAHSAYRLRSYLVASGRSMCWDFAGWHVYGFVFFTVATSGGPGPYFGVIYLRRRASHG